MVEVWLDNTLPATAVARRAAVLTQALKVAEPRRGLCGRCGGKKFDADVPAHERVSVRKCPVCKGAGSVRVGNTKR